MIQSKLGNLFMPLSKVLHLGSLAVQPHVACPAASARETSCSFKVLSIAAVSQMNQGDGSKEHESQLVVSSRQDGGKCLFFHTVATCCSIALLSTSSVSLTRRLISAKTSSACGRVRLVWMGGWPQLARLQMLLLLLLSRNCGRERPRCAGEVCSRPSSEAVGWC